MGTGPQARYFPNGASDGFARFAGRIPSEEGFFDLYVHSQGRGTSFAQLGVDGTVEVADMLAIEQSLLGSGWKPGQPIRVVSCRVGDPALGNQAAAQELADFLDVVVKAPTQDIVLFEDGTYVITNLAKVTPQTPSTGSWQEFRK
jgi:hypothetical protein